MAFIAIPVVFSPEIKTTLPPGMAGGVAQAILLRLFMWQVGFAGLSGLLFAWERFRDVESSGRLRAWLLPPLILLSLVSLFFVHPYLARMHQERYAIETPEPRRRELATRFGALHGATQGVNLMILIGVLACWQNVAHPVSSIAGRNGRVVP